nr:Chain B, iCAL36-VQDTRL peptide [synthetic construct]
VQDTRL